MLRVNEFTPFFMKTSFNIPVPKEQKRKVMRVNKDPLFCVLYQRVNNIDITTVEWEHFNEQNEKMKLAEQIDKLKFKNKDVIMNNLMYDKCINLQTLNILSLNYKVNLIFTTQRIYVEMIHPNIDAPIWIINEQFQWLNDPIESIRERFRVDLDKPLKSISGYKLPELQEISLRLHLPVDNYKKQQLYDSIKTTLDKIELIKS